MIVYKFSFCYRNDFIVSVVWWWFILVFVLSTFLRKMFKFVADVTIFVLVLSVKKFSSREYAELFLSDIDFHWLWSVVKLFIVFFLNFLSNITRWYLSFFKRRSYCRLFMIIVLLIIFCKSFERLILTISFLTFSRSF